MCATEEQNRLLSPGREAAGLFPGLAGPVTGTLLLRQILKNWLPRWLSSTLIDPVGEMTDGAVVAGVAAVALLAFVTDLVTAYLHLGAFRLCLDRAEGRPGEPPWRIFGQWKRYRGWVLWNLALTFGWVLGQRLLDTWVMYGFLPSSMQAHFYFTGKSYFNAAMTILSMLLFSLLTLSVRTAYLRAPGKGFWKAVGFGLREGLKKWPRAIGTQLIYVVPVHFGMREVTLLLFGLTYRMGGHGVSAVCNLMETLLGILVEAWVLTVYGCLAARVYEPPMETEGM